MTQAIQPSRNPISDSEMFARVQNALNQSMQTIEAQAGGDFTAYSMTLLLRSQFPTDEIDHDRVRELVHDLMGPVVSQASSTGWDAEIRSYPGGDAVTYFYSGPKTIQAVPAKNAQQLPSGLPDNLFS